MEVSSVKSEVQINLSIRQKYFQAATSPNTRRAYQSDIRHFGSLAKMPAQVDAVLTYLEKFANKLRISTLRRRLVAVQCWHQSLNFPSPCSDLRVTKMLRGIQRSHPRPIQSSRALSLCADHEINELLHAEAFLLACSLGKQNIIAVFLKYLNFNDSYVCANYALLISI